MTVDLTLPSVFVAATVTYYTLLFVLARWRRTPPVGGPAPLMVLLVPAREEEAVLAETLAALTGLAYRGEHRVLVVDDGSTDATAEIADRWARVDPRVRVLTRTPPDAGLGKSEALNHGYAEVVAWAAAGDPWLAGHDLADVVLVIVDADGRLDEHALSTVAPYFADPRVGSVQIGVRIANARSNTLARMQDIEFVGFSWLVQIARDRFGSSGLGGNGQFTRMAALASLGAAPWRPGALTEDLDLGLRLVAGGWRTRFCHTAHVEQQGLTAWRPLVRQRTRWIQGHYQCWRHLGSLAGARRASVTARVDLALYLVLVVTVLVVSATVVVGVLGTLGFVEVTNDFLTAVPYGRPRRLASLLLSVLPVAVFMGTYQRHSAHPFRWWQVPSAAVAFTAYGYVWSWVSLRALANLATGRNRWVKTPRVSTS